jgi:hypothetical protein
MDRKGGNRRPPVGRAGQRILSASRAELYPAGGGESQRARPAGSIRVGFRRGARKGASGGRPWRGSHGGRGEGPRAFGPGG